ncbi:TRAFAC clade GTPase domain-containing protein [Rhizobium sp. PP-CC-3G-465]|uniref:TRAFAC clade GTPase domain-containing protein n=1 Tax=Rhizobium sp. PP-CC-3G-465 TaxID=2135648 RepID=UPI0010E4E6AC|nr:hypothetical protein C8J33_1282 [Rhizobium sp. PP-CC-3G-465]
MSERSVVIIGLPESGKTTFLAALWHLVTAREVATRLRFANLRVGDAAHLNAIAARWRDAVEQDRTGLTGTRLVSMNLTDDVGQQVQISFPDVPGEAYRRMWEDRECSPEIADLLQANGVLLFIHADNIRAPSWVVDEVDLARKLGLDVTAENTVSWHPRLAPTQVQLVGLLQSLHAPPLDVGQRRLAVLFSAWDKVEVEGQDPTSFLNEKLPLLAQYLRQNSKWLTRVYGISAQGGDYDSVEAGAPPRDEAEELRRLDDASTRIKLLGPIPATHDLTEPLVWLRG